MAKRCLLCLTRAPTNDAWVKMWSEVTVQEGAGPMLQAARLHIPFACHAEARAVMQAAASAGMESLRFLRRVKTRSNIIVKVHTLIAIPSGLNFYSIRLAA